MDMPALYSLVRPDGQEYDVLLQEQSHSSRAGFASSTQAGLALYFKTKGPGIFGADKAAKNGHPFAAIDLTISRFLWGFDRVSEIRWKNLPRLWNLQFQNK
jgi:hypothetical protein